jgi:hypothetical protein
VCFKKDGSFAAGLLVLFSEKSAFDDAEQEKQVQVLPTKARGWKLRGASVTTVSRRSRTPGGWTSRRPVRGDVADTASELELGRFFLAECVYFSGPRSVRSRIKIIAAVAPQMYRSP